MKQLPLKKIWSGDGYGANSPVTLNQIKRNDKVAMYERFGPTGNREGYEVFHIKTRFKGQPLPGGLFEEEDREVYPSANQFGKIAWNPGTLERAELIYDQLNNPLSVEDAEIVKQEKLKVKEDKKIEKLNLKKEKKEKNLNLTIPSKAEFTVNDVIDVNKVDYYIASNFVKESITKGTVKFLKSESRGRGKPTNVYTVG